ncbi:acetyltransferase [Pannonibacter phragmitetus]|uniref:Acetyltransferase n=2 Tax=Pannonibacter phragmitetus TaxID=121719 RepID=A0A0U2W1P3_9HYPH|nr:GNAT family N-acetyltransferase [Pannonibacter phragmitetus]ALV26490.1 acetyltransferase [Pannonibacter phragmitetus]
MNMTDFCIRPYRPDDTPCLLRIWRAASELGHPFLGKDQLDAQEKLTAEIYLPMAETWVIEVNGQPAGFIGLLDDFIGGLFVDPAQHGRGLGKALVAHALKSRSSLDLEVYARNEAAHGFYRRLGFLEVGRRPEDDNGLPFEVIRLRLDKPF